MPESPEAACCFCCGVRGEVKNLIPSPADSRTSLGSCSRSDIPLHTSAARISALLVWSFLQQVCSVCVCTCAPFVILASAKKMHWHEIEKYGTLFAWTMKCAQYLQHPRMWVCSGFYEATLMKKRRSSMTSANRDLTFSMFAVCCLTYRGR